MKRLHKVLAVGLLAVASLGRTNAGRAATFIETIDAGNAYTTAADTTADGSAGTGLTQITGTIGGTDGTDADLFKIVLANPVVLMATTVNGATAVDTELALFDSTGHALLLNDDTSGTQTGSTLTVSLAAGNYFIGVSLGGNDPVNLSSQLLFQPIVNGDTTAVRGPASDLIPTTQAGYNDNAFFADAGAYQVDLSLVPEPSTWTAFAVGGGLAAFAFHRSRRRAA